MGRRPRFDVLYPPSQGGQRDVEPPEMVIDSEFYLMFVGFSALALGLVGLAPFSLPMWSQWLLFAFLVGGSTIGFRSSSADECTCRGFGESGGSR